MLTHGLSPQYKDKKGPSAEPKGLTCLDQFAYYFFAGAGVVVVVVVAVEVTVDVTADFVPGAGVCCWHPTKVKIATTTSAAMITEIFFIFFPPFFFI